MEIKTDIAAVTVPGNMLSQQTGTAAGKVSLNIAKADMTGITEEKRNWIGDRPVIQLSLKVDGKPYAWRNENAPVTVSIPYQPTPQEHADPEHIAVWYIDGQGNMVEVPSGRYDPATGMVIFTTTHFSGYAVVYVYKTFDDLESAAWAKKPIEVLASKGILKGISENEYAPKKNITGAEFLYFPVRTLGLETKADSNFDDISKNAYYYREIAIAKKLGIIGGVGNNKYNPDASITRQNMMVLSEKALRLQKKLAKQGSAAVLCL
ncbi:MAG TPA: S-layer homology domain-containing protein [Clostridia bacterium]|nr:S-layer homology domain-containing protein [Clostridia bacterium]